MRILGIDFETAGTRQEGIFRAVEVGFAIYDTTSKRLESSHGYLLNDLKITKDLNDVDLENYYMIPKEVSEIHGIDTNSVIQRGKTPLYFLADLVQEDLYQVDAIMVWNGYFFDKPLMIDIVDRFMIPEYSSLREQLLSLPWIDLKLDGAYKYRLDHEAADRGILSAYPHMGLADVITMFRVLDHDLEKNIKDIYTLFAISETPFVIAEANTQYHERELAKKAGFKWNPTLKVWWKLIREYDIEHQSSSWGFNVSTRVATPEIYDSYFKY